MSVTLNPATIENVERLMEQLGVSKSEAIEVALATVDWDRIASR